jgi:hypothetical protein
MQPMTFAIALVAALLAPGAFADDAKRMEVVDRPTLFPLRELETAEEKGFGKGASIRWRTDDELLVSATEYKGWKATGAWGQRAFRWHIATGQVTETTYTGQVVCTTGSRIVLRRNVADASDPEGKKQLATYSGAAFWDPAVTIPSGAYNEYSCEPMSRRVSGDFGPNTFLLPLRPGHGSILKETKPLYRSVWFLPKAGGEKIQIGENVSGGFGEMVSNLADPGPTYLSWLDQYLFGGYRGDHRHQRMSGYDIRLLFLSPDGRVEARREPPPINEWKKREGLAVSFAATRAGVVWAVQSAIRSRPSDHDGLYIERDGSLVRFMRDASLTQRGVAPGGCRALVVPDREPRGSQPTKVQLIEFCEGETK